MNGQDPPELTVKFWRTTVTARGAKAIDAIRRPLAFAVYAKSASAVLLGFAVVFRGHEYAGPALRYLMSFVGF